MSKEKMETSKAIAVTASILGILLIIVLVLVLCMNLGSGTSQSAKQGTKQVIVQPNTHKCGSCANHDNQISQNVPYVYSSFYYKPSDYKNRKHLQRHGIWPKPKPKVPDNRLPINAAHD